MNYAEGMEDFLRTFFKWNESFLKKVQPLWETAEHNPYTTRVTDRTRISKDVASVFYFPSFPEKEILMGRDSALGEMEQELTEEIRSIAHESGIVNPRVYFREPTRTDTPHYNLTTSGFVFILPTKKQIATRIRHLDEGSVDLLFDEAPLLPEKNPYDYEYNNTPCVISHNGQGTSFAPDGSFSFEGETIYEFHVLSRYDGQHKLGSPILFGTRDPTGALSAFLHELKDV